MILAGYHSKVEIGEIKARLNVTFNPLHNASVYHFLTEGWGNSEMDEIKIGITGNVIRLHNASVYHKVLKCREKGKRELVILQLRVLSIRRCNTSYSPGIPIRRARFPRITTRSFPPYRWGNVDSFSPLFPQ